MSKSSANPILTCKKVQDFIPIDKSVSNFTLHIFLIARAYLSKSGKIGTSRAWRKGTMG
jgi:hypothetical protein